MSNEALDIIIIAGNRPEIIKLSELVKSLSHNYKSAFVYTGQHYSSSMKDVFLDELGIKFDYDLKCNTSDVNILRQNIRKLLHNTNPTYVIVYGDTNTTLAGALAAKDEKCKLIHIEAGLRCFDLSKVEERNRIHIDSISDYFLAPTELNRMFLKYEGIKDDQIFVTGNLIVDICKKFFNTSYYRLMNDLSSKYILLTLHRAELVDDPTMLKKLPAFLSQIKYNIIFPVHPRTRTNLIKYNIHMPRHVTLIDPVGHSDFLDLLKNCMIVITDSGGVQEEAVIFKKPCITLNNVTERLETLLIKSNKLFFPLDGNQLKFSISDAIEEMLSAKITVNPYGENVTSKAFHAISGIIASTRQRVPAEVSPSLKAT
jgi:UDP-N-acetylglucosamine 2-epimerase (non-hydrolysing)